MSIIISENNSGAFIFIIIKVKLLFNMITEDTSMDSDKI